MSPERPILLAQKLLQALQKDFQPRVQSCTHLEDGLDANVEGPAGALARMHLLA